MAITAKNRTHSLCTRGKRGAATAWLLAAAAPLVVGLGIAVSQSVVGWASALAAVNPPCLCCC